MPNSPDDILFGAAVDDKTGQFFDRFDQRLTQSEQRASGSFAGIEKSIGGAGVAAGLFGGIIGGALFKIGDMAMQALGNFQNILKTAGDLRARADTLAITLAKVANNAGYSKDEIAGLEKDMRKMGITLLGTRDSLTQMIQSELDLSQATKLARVAQDAAVLSGQNSTETFQRLIHGITTLQPEILRMNKLYINYDQVLRKGATALGKNAQQLTIMEKQQILLNATIEAGDAIAGSYVDSLDSVGKKTASLERVQEDLLVALGAIRQPIDVVWIDTMTEKLSEIRDFLEENQEALIQMGEIGAKAFGLLITAALKVIEIITKLPQNIEDISVAFGKLISGLEESEVEERLSQLPKLLSILYGVWMASWTGMFQIYKSFVAGIAALSGALKKALSGDIVGALEDVAIASGVVFVNGMDAIMKAFEDGTLAAGEFFGAVEESDEAAAEMEDFSTHAALEAKKFAAAIEEANAALGKFYDEVQKDIEVRGIKQAREEIEAALRASFEAEDIARQHAERVAQIMQGADASRESAMRQNSQRRIDIEKDYQRRIRDIKRNFEFDAEELARARDAVGLLRLMRQNKKNLQEAKITRDDAKKDAQTAYQQQLQDLDKRRQEQLAALAIQEQKEEESRQRALDRQRQIQALHDQWEEEDRKKKQAEQLAAILKQLSGIEGITKDGLDDILDQWRVYFGDLVDMAVTEMNRVATIMAPSTGGQSSMLQIPQPNSASGSSSMLQIPQPSQGLRGQAGLVSSLLANPAMLNPNTVPQVPAVAPMQSSGAGRKEIDVNVRGEAFNPYIQRVLATALMEIFRNSGNVLPV